MIKCIVCDLDGTLIKRDDTIEEKTYQKLKTCMDKGIEFMIATGRDINMVVDFLKRYDLDCDLILNNGTQFRNLSGSRQDIYPMDNTAFLKIVHILNDYGYLLAIHTDQGKYSLVDANTFWDYHLKLILKNTKYGSLNELPQKTFTTREGYLRDFHYVPDPQEIIDQGIHVLKIDARHLDTYSLQGVRDKLNIDGLEFSSSFEDNIEITTNQFNKGIMLEKVAQQKGYGYDEVAVFGDGLNDVGMLERFQYSFAPANAGAAAKKAAAYQLTKTDETGAVGEGIDILKDLHLI